MEISLEFLQTIIDHLRIGVVVIDTDNKIALFNREAGEMLQVDPMAGLIIRAECSTSTYIPFAIRMVPMWA